MSSDVVSTSTIQTIPSLIPVTPTPYAVVSLLTYQEALEQMYGKDVSVYPNNEASAVMADGVTYTININVFSCYWHVSGAETCLVITDRSYEHPCHGCGADIDGAVFSRTYRGWSLRSFRSKITQMGSFGRAPKGEIIQIGPEKYAVQFNWEYSSTGSTVEHLVIITENSFDVVLDIISRGERLLPHDKMEGWNSRLYFQKTYEDSKYYDLIVTYYGDSNGNDMPYQEFYTFSDGKYILAWKKSY